MHAKPYEVRPSGPYNQNRVEALERLNNKLNIHIDNQIYNKQRYGGISQYFNELKEGIESDINFALSERSNADLIHATYYYGRPYKLRTNQNIVTTLYDMTPEKYPEYFIFSKFRSPHANKKNWFEASEVIISISQASADDMEFYWPHLSPKIRVIHLSTNINELKGEPIAKFTTNGYFLFIGKRSGYKNALMLLRALYHLKKKSVYPRIVFAGGGPLSRVEKSLIKRLNLNRQVIQVDVTREQIKWLLDNTVATLIPSIAEGFSLPIIESLSCKTPVIASDIEAHREVGGKLVHYLPAQNAKSWAEAIGESNAQKPWFNHEMPSDLYHERIIYYGNKRMLNEHYKTYKSIL